VNSVASSGNDVFDEVASDEDASDEEVSE